MTEAGMSGLTPPPGDVSPNSFVSPTFFVGTLPPPALSVRISDWQARLEHVITAPHVTLKAPGQYRAAPLTAFGQVCGRTSPFEVAIGGVRTFPDRVIYLEAVGAGLKALHTELVAATGPPPGAFELAGYQPHLTLALGWRPLRLDWPEVLASAQEEFAALEAEPLRFTVREVVLFRKDRPGERYQEETRWKLKGQSG